MDPEKFKTADTFGWLTPLEFTPGQRESLAKSLGSRTASESTRKKIEAFIDAAEKSLGVYLPAYKEPETNRGDNLCRLKKISEHASALSIQLKAIPIGLARGLSTEVRWQTRLDEEYIDLKTKILQKDHFHPTSEFNDFDLSDVPATTDILDLLTLASRDLAETISDEVPENVGGLKLREKWITTVLAKDYRRAFGKPPGYGPKARFDRFMRELGPIIKMVFGEGVIPKGIKAALLKKR